MKTLEEFYNSWDGEEQSLEDYVIKYFKTYYKGQEITFYSIERNIGMFMATHEDVTDLYVLIGEIEEDNDL